MGILTGLFAYLRSASRKLVQAMFGWAVQALFGTPRESEKTILSVVVAAAALWPLLPFGVAFPKLAAFVLAFVPIPKSVPSSAIRAVWIAGVLVVPVVVGLALAKRGNPEIGPEPFWRRAIRGFPVTIAIAAGFAVAFFTSSIRRLATMARRWEDEHVPLLSEVEDYARVAEGVRGALEEGGLPVQRADPPWLLTAPTRVLRRLGGKILRLRTPETLVYYTEPGRLEVAVQPNGVTVRGEPEAAARAHSLISERGTMLPALQTTDAAAQELERRLKDIWNVYARDPDAHAGSTVLKARLDAFAEELGETFIPYEQWQIVYRELLQVARGVGGSAQLIALSQSQEVTMNDRDRQPERPKPARAVVAGPTRALSSAELVRGIRREFSELIDRQAELAREELRENVRAEIAAAWWLAAAGLVGISFLTMLFVAAALALAAKLLPWLAALIVAGALLCLAGVLGFVGWSRRVPPLETTRKTLKESWEWARNRIA